MMTRRNALKTTALAAAACAIAPTLRAADAAAPTGPFTLPKLPYPTDALEPHIDARTMEIHHDKHHAAYVTNLNKALAEFPDLGKQSIEDLLKNVNMIPEKIRTSVLNQGGGHYNHSLFWQMMKKGGGGEPGGELAKAIDKSFGSFAEFKQKFTEMATKHFGSGWIWLIASSGKNLNLMEADNQDAPVTYKMGNSTAEQAVKKRYNLPGDDGESVPLLGIDIWEHAYYLKYQNRRPEYIAAWFNVINWDFVAESYAKLKA